MVVPAADKTQKTNSEVIQPSEPTLTYKVSIDPPWSTSSGATLTACAHVSSSHTLSVLSNLNEKCTQVYTV